MKYSCHLQYYPSPGPSLRATTHSNSSPLSWYFSSSPSCRYYCIPTFFFFIFFPHKISPKSSTLQYIYHMVMRLKEPQHHTVSQLGINCDLQYLHNFNQLFLSSNGIRKIQRIYLCFNSQYKQLFTLTLANKLGFEHYVICFDIKCESIGKLVKKNGQFWSSLSLCVKEVQALKMCVYSICILCQSNNKCVNCIANTDGCCANCVKSLFYCTLLPWNSMELFSILGYEHLSASVPVTPANHNTDI